MFQVEQKNYDWRKTVQAICKSCYAGYHSHCTRIENTPDQISKYDLWCVCNCEEEADT